MNKLTAYLLIAALIAITVPPVFAQQNQNTQEQEIETLKKQVLELQKQLQTVENVEKMELAAKLSEAQAKLAEANVKIIDTDFDKLKLELKDSNQQWLWGWTAFLGVMFAVFGVALWFVVKSMIADKVEGHLKGFQEAFDQVNTLKDELEVLKKELAVIVLDDFDPHYPVELEWHTEAIKTISEDMLLGIFSDKTRDLGIRWKAADVLLTRNSTRLISPVIMTLNNIVDSDLEKRTFGERFRLPSEFWSRLNGISNKETYQGLKNLLNLLITDNPKSKDIFLTWTVILLAQISSELDRSDSVSMITETIPDLDDYSFEEKDLKSLVEYLIKFKEREGIKEILTNKFTDKYVDVETQCLEFLQEHDSDFVKNWKAQKETAMTENEESS